MNCEHRKRQYLGDDMLSEEKSVIFKGKNRGIVVQLDKNTEYSVIKEILKKKVIESKSFLDGPKNIISFKGRELTPDEETELTGIISSNSNGNITFVKYEEDANSNDKNASNVAFLNKAVVGKNTIYHNGTIRSGQRLESKSSIVVIGDVNPGGEVKSGGNIVVFGHLKGLAHAGHAGNLNCFIAAIGLRPIQLRIGDIITRFPDNPDVSINKTPCIAYIVDGKMFVEQRSSLI